MSTTPSPAQRYRTAQLAGRALALLKTTIRYAVPDANDATGYSPAQCNSATPGAELIVQLPQELKPPTMVSPSVSRERISNEFLTLVEREVNDVIATDQLYEDQPLTLIDEFDIQRGIDWRFLHLEQERVRLEELEASLAAARAAEQAAQQDNVVPIASFHQPVPQPAPLVQPTPAPYTDSVDWRRA